MKKVRILLLSLTIISLPLLFESCKKAKIEVNNSTGDGDVTGKGGSKTETFTWENNQSKAEYNMDITASSGGSMQIEVLDANGTKVIDQTLTGGSGPDSKDGCSSSGTAGSWTVTITLTDFDGDGSYSLSKGC